MPLRRPLHGLPLSGLLLAATAAVAGAQGPAADSVPRELAVALLAASGAGTPQLLIGQASPQLPAGILSGDALVLGSAIYDARSVTVAVALQRPPEVEAALEARLLAAGWVSPQPGGLFAEQRGFLPSTSGAARGLGFCKDDMHIAPSVESWSRGRTLVRVHLSRAGGNSVCTMSREPRREMGRMAGDSMMPALRPPPGARVEPRGGSGNSESSTQSARIEVRSETAELLAHYGTQMRQAGWELAGEAPGAAVASQLWRRSDAAGRLWLGTVVLIRHPETAAGTMPRYSALLRVESGGDR